MNGSIWIAFTWNGVREFQLYKIEGSGSFFSARGSGVAPPPRITRTSSLSPQPQITSHQSSIPLPCLNTRSFHQTIIPHKGSRWQLLHILLHILQYLLLALFRYSRGCLVNMLGHIGGQGCHGF